MRKLTAASGRAASAALVLAVLSACAPTAGSRGPAAGTLPAGSPSSGDPGQAAHAGTGATRARAGGARAGRGGQARPLAGTIVGIDPGHNGGNAGNPSYIDHQIWNGREWEACDTTGTETNGGYTESRFTFRVASFLRKNLREAGARVVMTRPGNHGTGPCVNRRAEILNRAHANVAIDIHADGGPAWGRGFSILEPVADGRNNKIIKASARLGIDVRRAMLAHTAMPVSNYYGHDGIQPRNDLAGLNLATEPKVLIECGNMRNATDALLLISAAFQRRLARALAGAITAYLTARS